MTKLSNQLILLSKLISFLFCYSNGLGLIQTLSNFRYLCLILLLMPNRLRICKKCRHNKQHSFSLHLLLVCKEIFDLAVLFVTSCCIFLPRFVNSFCVIIDWKRSNVKSQDTPYVYMRGLRYYAGFNWSKLQETLKLDSLRLLDDYKILLSDVYMILVSGSN